MGILCYNKTNLLCKELNLNKLNHKKVFFVIVLQSNYSNVEFLLTINNCCF